MMFPQWEGGFPLILGGGYVIEHRSGTLRRPSYRHLERKQLSLHLEGGRARWAISLLDIGYCIAVDNETGARDALLHCCNACRKIWKQIQPIVLECRHSTLLMH